MTSTGDSVHDGHDYEDSNPMASEDDPLVASVLNTPADPRTNQPRNEFEKSADYANYFITYGLLCHQKQMLEDQHRMDTYHRAIVNNPDCFKDKVVLDLGTGTGVLAIWAALAGARKVYAVEATPMARFAEKLIAANGLDKIITVIQGKVEDLPVPEEKADVMVSEWMGYLLLRESMLDSVVYARDHWMKPNGAMYPSHATIYVAPIATNDTEKSVRTLTQEVVAWKDFATRTKAMFGFDLSAVQEDYMTEQRVYHLQTVAWRDLPASCLLGSESAILTMDLHTVKVEDYRSFKADFDCLVRGKATANALAGWFEVEFKGPYRAEFLRVGLVCAEALRVCDDFLRERYVGSKECPTKHVVRLSTAPVPNGRGTHWGQQLFFLHPSLSFGMGDRLRGTIEMERNAYNHRLLDFALDYHIKRQSGAEEAKQSLRYVLE